MVEQSQEKVSLLPRLDISNEAYRTYEYADGTNLTVRNAVTLILEKKDGVGQDRHRLIIDKPGGGQEGMYVAPGWRAIRWQAKNGEHGITF